MNKYIKTDKHILIRFNTDDNKVSSIDNICSNIDWIWVLDEDGEFDGLPVTAGDVLIRFYPIEQLNVDSNYMLIKDSNLREYYKKLSEYRQTVLSEKSECCSMCKSCCA